MATKKFKIAFTGDRDIDRKLRDIASEQGPRSINKEIRGATRDAIKQIVQPQVISQVPYETGFLESQFTVKSIGRSRSKIGTAIGFKDDMFRGDTFYAGFHEYGFHAPDGSIVPGDSFLRRPLYDSEGRIRRFVIGRIRSWIGSLKR